MVTARRRVASINLHLLGIMSEHGLDSVEGSCGTERPASGGERGSNILNGRAVRPVKLADHVFPSHVVMAWVALRIDVSREMLAGVERRGERASTYGNSPAAAVDAGS